MPAAEQAPSPDEAPAGAGRRALFGLIALGAVLVLGLVVAEVMIRVVAREGTPLEERLRAYDPLAILVEPHGTAGYRARPAAAFRYRNGTTAHVNAQRFRGPVVAVPKPADAVRIVLLGGSTTFGWGVDDTASIDAHLAPLLAARLPGRRVEVVNAALDGYDTWQLLQRVHSDVLALDPDLLVVNTGINDVRNARYAGLVDADPRTLLWEVPMQRMREEQARGGPSAWTLVKHWSFVVRLGALLRDEARARAAAPAAPAGPPPRDSVYGDAADYFERNVRAIGEAARDRGIAVLFATPASSLRTRYAPGDRSTITYWLNDAAETQVYRDTLAARLRSLGDALAASGLVTAYVRPDVPPEEFLDDAHLTGAGNRRVAGVFADAIVPLLAARER